MKSTIVCLFLVCFLCGCAPRVTIKAPVTRLRPLPLRIENVALSSKSFNPGQGETAGIQYKLSEDARVTIKIYDSDDTLIRTLLDNYPQPKGVHTHYWDGSNDWGSIVPDEVYIYVISIKDELGREFLYDPADDTGGIKLVTRELQLDQETGEIAYVLPKAGRIRIRIGIKDGALLRTLVDWQPRVAGANKELWDGMDKSHLMKLLGNPKISLVMEAFSLPDNSIITKGNSKDINQPTEGLPVIKTKNSEKRPKGTLPKQEMSRHLHSKHPRKICHEPAFRIEFPNHSKNEDGLHEVWGIVPVRIYIAERDKKYLTDTRFEIMIFVDNIFIFEDEEGISPFTYQWNTKGINEGPHILTVNIQDYQDHVGTESVQVSIRKR